MSTNTSPSRVKHCVLLNFPPGTSDELKAGIFAALQALPKDELGIVEMVSGPFAASSSAPSSPYTDGLVVTFRSVEDRDRYNGDAQHQAILHDKILPAVGGTRGLLRFDFVETP